MSGIPRDYPVGHAQPALTPLSFAEAQEMGQAMVERWQREAPFKRLPFSSEDAAWADLARAAYECLIALRRA